MRCEAATEALLDADPAVLAGRDDDSVSRHVRGCPRCARVAARFLEAEAELARELSATAVPPEPSVVEEALRAARVRRAGWRVWGPALAAAAVAGVLLWPRGDHATTGRLTLAPPERLETPVVEIPADRNAVVLSTRDPSITVVWFFERGERE